MYDAFGNDAGRTGTTPNSFRFTGEQFDDITKLTYLRARWLNNSTGRFMTVDPHPGNMRRPLTLNDYSYAVSNPVLGVDPTGRFTLGDVISASSSAINIASNALTAYDYLFGDDDSEVDAPASIWDYLMAGSVQGFFASLAPGVASSNGGGWGPPQRHHVIPVYVCGAVTGGTSTIPKSVHDTIHFELERFVYTTNVAGVAMNLLFKKPRSRSVKTPIQRLGSKPVGRQAIAAGLFAFYADHNYLDNGTPKLFAALAAETILFIKPKGGRHSAPSCQRP